jgi:hypothetical protein
LLFRFVSDVYAYDEATPQGVWRAETGRQTQDDLVRNLWGCIEINLGSRVVGGDQMR